MSELTKSEQEQAKKAEAVKKTAKNSDGATVLDPQGNHYDPEKNFNTGDQVTVVMMGGKPVAVKNGVILDNNKVEKKAEDLNKEELDYAKENKENLQEVEGTLPDSEKEKQDNSVIQGVKAKVTQLPEEKLIDTE